MYLKLINNFWSISECVATVTAISLQYFFLSNTKSVCSIRTDSGYFVQGFMGPVVAAGKASLIADPEDTKLPPRGNPWHSSP